MSKDLSKGGVVYENVWFSDTRIGRDHIASPKAYRAANLIEKPLGGTVRENLGRDLVFKPSHRLFVYPTEENRDGTYTVRWELKNTHTGIRRLGAVHDHVSAPCDMDADQARAAAAAFVNVVIAKLRRCKVIPDTAN